VASQLPDFETVFAEHSAFVWRVLGRYGVAERDLEDACQEVFMIVFKSASEFEGRSTLKTWIYGICRRVAANHRRRAAVRHESPAAQPEQLSAAGAHDDADAFDAFARKQSLELLELLIARLPDEQREVFVLYEIEELSMREVAEVLECSQNTAFSRLYAARREIEAALKRLRAKRRVA
jgi:RNA polymerase sigma-70 factor (ECF subfamily)